MITFRTLAAIWTIFCLWGLYIIWKDICLGGGHCDAGGSKVPAMAVMTVLIIIGNIGIEMYGRWLTKPLRR